MCWSNGIFIAPAHEMDEPSSTDTASVYVERPHSKLVKDIEMNGELCMSCIYELRSFLA